MPIFHDNPPPAPSSLAANPVALRLANRREFEGQSLVEKLPDSAEPYLSTAMIVHCQSPVRERNRPTVVDLGDTP